MTYHSGRHFLQIPGPTNVPSRILRAIDRPTIDHRGPTFTRLAFEVLEGIKTIFQTSQPVIIYPSSGTGLGRLKGKVFRIGHLGDFNELMLAGTLCGVQMGLMLAGIPHHDGIAVALDFLTNHPGVVVPEL